MIRRAIAAVALLDELVKTAIPQLRYSRQIQAQRQALETLEWYMWVGSVE